jgi:penicillin-binding protein 2
MNKMFNENRRIVDSRFIWANVIILVITSLLMVRLWYVQIYRGDYYKRLAESNRFQYIEITAPRGIIYDRNGSVVLGNRPYFDMVMIPQYLRDKETTFSAMSKLLHTPASVFERRLRMVKGQPKYLPISLKRNLSLHEVSIIQNNKVFLQGIDVAVAPRRDYSPVTPSHMVGYLGEISRNELNRLNEDQDTPIYRSGDLIGKQGLEARWEKYLRGKRGHRLVQVDAYGRQADLTEKSEITLPRVPAIPGNDLILTIDLDLQTAARDAFKGKNGAVVVMDPRNGEVLAMLSEPGYDPNIYQGVLSQEKYRSLVNNPFKPFLDKTTGGMFMPGSVYKAVVALAALEEGIVNPNTTFNCPGRYTLHGETFHCHERAGHGVVNLRRAMMKSCDVYFYNIGFELGVDRIAKYAADLGLGEKTGFQLNFELPGLIPTIAWKKKFYNTSWSPGETPSVSIGQGAVQMTPIQMANLYATLGNGGNIWKPFLVKRVINHVGESILVHDPELIRKVGRISPASLKLVKEALTAVVMDPEGTGKAAAVPDVTVAGKTGSVQVVSLSKNQTKLDVSMKWREHAMFAAFSPADTPEISVAVISEHDKVGGGGKSAAPVAGKIIAAYWELKKKRAASKEAIKTAEKPEQIKPESL